MFNDLPLIVPQQPIDTRRLLVHLTDETVLKGVNTLPLFGPLPVLPGSPCCCWRCRLRGEGL